jgi:hypothetical protein
MTEQEPTRVDFRFGRYLPVDVDRFSVDARTEPVLVARLTKQMGIKISLKTFMTNPTVRAIDK